MLYRRVLTLCDVDGVAGESSTLPYQAALLGEETRNLPADKLVRGRLLAVRVKL